MNTSSDYTHVGGYGGYGGYGDERGSQDTNSVVVMTGRIETAPEQVTVRNDNQSIVVGRKMEMERDSDTPALEHCKQIISFSKTEKEAMTMTSPLLPSSVWNAEIFNSELDTVEKCTDHIWLVPKWLQPEACQQICQVMRAGLLNRPRRSFGTGRWDFYDSLEYDPRVAEVFTSQLKKQNFFPMYYHDQHKKLWKFRQVNNTYPLAMYQANQEFGPHQDTATVLPNGVVGKFTCLIYLNNDFQGGETIFYQNVIPRRGLVPKPDQLMPGVHVIPQTGMALFFDTDLIHQGAKVVEGEKCWIGFELCYQEVTDHLWERDIETAAYYRAEKDQFRQSTDVYWCQAEEELMKMKIQ